MTKTTSNIVFGTTLLLAVGIVANMLMGDTLTRFWPFESEQPSQAPAPQEMPPFVGTFTLSLLPRATGERAGMYRIDARTGELKL